MEWTLQSWHSVNIDEVVSCHLKNYKKKHYKIKKYIFLVLKYETLQPLTLFTLVKYL